MSTRITGCPVCGGGDVREAFRAREMMMGTRDTFEYHRCAGCASLWLAEPPADLAPYYAEGYYSFDGLPMEAPTRMRTAAMRWLLATPSFPVTAAAGRVRGVPSTLGWLAAIGVRQHDPVADIGSGEGELLRRMAAFGFTDLWGFDPFVQADRDEGPMHIRKAPIEAIPEGHFATVMMHHALEHIADPLAALTSAATKLRRGGRMVIRIPIAAAYADRQYGADWVQLDPPRHLHVPTERGFRQLAERAGLRVTAAYYDSYAIQFWGSEQYRADIPLTDPRSVLKGSEEFATRKQVVHWERQSRHLNARRDGDSACFVLAAA